jgi:photosystem II stability/assembly factor-like uncharacterized protein
MAIRTISRGSHAWLLVLLLLPLGCLVQDPSGTSYLALQDFASSADYDTVLVILERADGTRDTLYLGPPHAEDLEKIPIPDLKGEKVLVLVDGYQQGVLVFSKSLYYDGATQTLDSTVLWRSPQSRVRIDTAGWPGHLRAGDSLRLPGASVSPVQLKDRSLTWRSRNPDIARIDSPWVRTLKEGTVDLLSRLVSDSARYDSIFLQVTARPPVGPSPPDSLRLRPDTLRVTANGAPDSFALEIIPAGADSAVKWRSGGGSIAMVSERGVVQGLSEGGILVTVRSKHDSTVYAEAWVEVATPVVVDSIRLATNDTLYLYVDGAAQEVDAQVFPSRADQAFTMKAEDGSVAAIEGRLVRGLKEGATRLIARSRADTAKVDSLQVVVMVKVVINRVTANPKDVLLYTGGPDTVLTAEVDPSSAPRGVIWRLSASGVANLSAQGRLKALAPGHVVAWALSLADSMARDSVRVLVKRDMPKLSVGRLDTAVGVDSIVVFRPVVAQEYGGIAVFAWDLDGDGVWDDSSKAVPDSLPHSYSKKGDYPTRFYVRDTEGNETTVVKTVRLVEGPIVLILSPVDGFATNQKNLPVSWSVNGSLQNATNVEVLKTQGPNTITRSAGDSAGNLNSASITVYWDTVPPNPPVGVSPSLVNNKTPTWTWTSGNGGGNGQYRLNLDGPIPSNAPAQSDTAFTSPIELGEGLHTLFLQERDQAGNWSANTRLAVLVDVTPPDPPSVHPAGPTPTNSHRPKWAWTSGGKGGIGRFRVKLNGKELESGAIPVQDTGYTADSLVDEGSYTLYVQENDSAGNWSASGNASVVLDFSPPSAPVIKVNLPSPTNNPRPTWSWTSEGNGAARYRYHLDDSVMSHGATEDTTTTFQPALNLAEGQHTLYLQERDAAGNWSKSGSATITLDLTGPNAPKVTSTSPATTTLQPTWTWSSGNGGGIGSFRYKLDDSALATGAIPSMDTSYTPPGNLGEGSHTLYVQEQDSVGNWSPSGYFRIYIHGHTGYATGSTLSILKTEDAGYAWQWEAGGSFASVYFTNSTTGYVVENRGVILKTSNAGATWIPYNTGISATLVSIQFPDADNGYIVGLNGTILKTNNAGASWTALNSGTTNSLYSVFFTDAANGYAVGASGIILKTTDAGATWKPLTSGTLESLSSIYFFDAMTGFIVGGAGTILKTTDAGASWTSIPSGTTRFLTSVFFADARNGFAVGYRGTLLKSINGGISWTPLDISITDFVSLFMPNSTTIYVVGSSGVIYKSIDGGAAWKSLRNAYYADIPSIYFTDALTGYAVGNYGALLKTTDGGDSWMPLIHYDEASFYNGGSNGLSSIFFTSKSIGYVVGEHGRILKTTNAGGSWAVQTSGTTEDLFSVYFTGENTGYASGYYGTLLKTTNAGAAWTPLDPKSSELLFCTRFVDENVGFVVGTSGTILKTIDAGATWKPMASGISNTLYSVTFLDADMGFAVGSAGAILKTTDAGISWSLLNSGTTSNLRSIAFASKSDGVAVGENGTILKTTDSGNTWSLKYSGTTITLRSVQFMDANNGIIVGEKGAVFLTSNAGTYWSTRSSKTPANLTSVFFP